MTDALTAVAAKSLGDSTSYAVFTDKFDPSLLNPMPRALARGDTEVNFYGIDIWNCHEATFMTANGYPIAGTLSFWYTSDTPNMVESKSAKLYLNSFDMCRMGDTAEEAIKNYVGQVKRDLSRVVGGDVSVVFYPSASPLSPDPNYFSYVATYDQAYKVNILKDSSDLAYDFDVQSNCYYDFQGEHNRLCSVSPYPKDTYQYYTNALRSRCRHTKQKDTGTAWVQIIGKTVVTPQSIMEEIVSLREVNEFHEFCAEKLFMDFEEVLNEGDTVMIGLQYARRGSLDINPFRWSKKLGTAPPVLRPILRDGALLQKTQGQ